MGSAYFNEQENHLIDELYMINENLLRFFSIAYRLAIKEHCEYKTIVDMIKDREGKERVALENLTQNPRFATRVVKFVLSKYNEIRLYTPFIDMITGNIDGLKLSQKLAFNIMWALSKSKNAGQIVCDSYNIPFESDAGYEYGNDVAKAIRLEKLRNFIFLINSNLNNHNYASQGDILLRSIFDACFFNSSLSRYYFQDENMDDETLKNVQNFENIGDAVKAMALKINNMKEMDMIYRTMLRTDDSHFKDKETVANALKCQLYMRAILSMLDNDTVNLIQNNYQDYISSNEITKSKINTDFTQSIINTAFRKAREDRQLIRTAFNNPRRPL